jgi:hypothetical protein
VNGSLSHLIRLRIRILILILITTLSGILEKACGILVRETQLGLEYARVKVLSFHDGILRVQREPTSRVVSAGHDDAKVRTGRQTHARHIFLKELLHQH